MGLFGKGRGRQDQVLVDVAARALTMTSEDRANMIRAALAGLETPEAARLIYPLLAELFPSWVGGVVVEDEPAPESAAPAWRDKKVGDYRANVAADPDGVLYARTVSFSGDLSGMTRDEAAAAIAALGGIVSVNVTRTTDVLVLGEAPGAKYDRAIRYVKDGQAIEVIDEATLRRYLAGATFTSEGRERPVTNLERRAIEREAAEARKAQAAQERAERPAAKPYEPVTDQVIVDGVEMVELVCRSCGAVWTRPPQRGRVPLLCPECRAAGKRF